MNKTRLPDAKNRRRVFRLRLPADSMLTVMIGGEVYDVAEISEYSLRVTTQDVNHEEGVCTGTIRWSDGEESKFTGGLGRIQNHCRVIWKIEGISMHQIVAEQRRLIIKYPMSLAQKRA